MRIIVWETLAACANIGATFCDQYINSIRLTHRPAALENEVHPYCKEAPRSNETTDTTAQ